MITIVLVTGSILLAACTAAQTAPPMPINNTGWRLETLNGQPVLPNKAVTLNFADGRLNGTDGCNLYNATYALNGSAISVNKNIASTMMACDDPIMKQAQAYTNALTQAVTYKADGKTLSLVDVSGKAVAVFMIQSKELAGTSWNVTSYNNGKQAVVSVLADTKLNLVFSADGKASGSAGCNTYAGGYESSSASNTIKMNQMISTLKACLTPPEIMTQESQYLKALGNAATYSIDAGQLVIRDSTGAMVATFKQAQ